MTKAKIEELANQLGMDDDFKEKAIMLDEAIRNASTAAKKQIIQHMEGLEDKAGKSIMVIGASVQVYDSLLAMFIRAYEKGMNLQHTDLLLQLHGVIEERAAQVRELYEKAKKEHVH